jgi:hypothetical protein
MRNAEQLDISATTRLDFQVYKDPTLEKRFLNYSAFQQSLNFSLAIPKPYMLKQLEHHPKVRSIKTNFNVSYLYEFNPDYIRVAFEGPLWALFAVIAAGIAIFGTLIMAAVHAGRWES